MPVVNRADLAAIFGVAKTTVDQWLREGCPCLGGGRRGVERRLDTLAVHRWLIARELAAPDPKAPTTPEGEISLHEALRRKEVANAKSAELELAAAMEVVAPVDTLKRIIGEELAATKTRLREIPAKLLPAARSCATSGAKAKRMVDAVSDLIEGALTEIKFA